MTTPLRRTSEGLAIDRLVREFLPAPEFFEEAFYADRATIEHRQALRAKEEIWRASKLGFFNRRWEESGYDPASFSTIDDLSSVPMYDVDDIRESIEMYPPYGDYQGVSVEDAIVTPQRIYWSGGTTGTPRPTLYTQWDREVSALLSARALYLHGIRPGDVVLNAWSYSTHAGAWVFDEALYRWLNCVVITTGGGNVTSTRRQVEFAHQYGAKAILASGDYLLQMAEVAKEMGLDPQKDLQVRTMPAIGDRDKLRAAWGVPVYGSYGIHETGYIAAECPAGGGMHIWEDAFAVQIVDPDTREPLPDGELGCIVLTELYKTGSPQVRFNTQDLSFLYPPEQCECGSWYRRMGDFAGRADNMVKLRGVNVWPEAVGKIVTGDPRVEPDYHVTALRVGERDELLCRVVTSAPEENLGDIKRELEAELKERLLVRIGVELVRPGAIDDLTGRGVSPKLSRFEDRR